MDSAALDRALCEKLGIAPRLMMWQVGDEAGVHVFSHWDATLVQQWHERHREYCDRLGYQVREAPIYPSLSTTGDGMLILMEALQKAKHAFTIDAGYVVFVSTQSGGSRFRVVRREVASAPLALALAAAAALGIEVQP